MVPATGNYWERFPQSRTIMINCIVLTHFHSLNSLVIDYNVRYAPRTKQQYSQFQTSPANIVGRRQTLAIERSGVNVTVFALHQLQ
jgi:hypothetical protein